MFQHNEYDHGNVAMKVIIKHCRSARGAFLSENESKTWAKAKIIYVRVLSVSDWICRLHVIGSFSAQSAGRCEITKNKTILS